MLTSISYEEFPASYIGYQTIHNKWRLKQYLIVQLLLIHSFVFLRDIVPFKVEAFVWLGRRPTLNIVEFRVESGASINIISPQIVKNHDLIEQPAPLLRYIKLLDSHSSLCNTKVLSTLMLPMKSWTSAHKHEFTVAPSSNHDALLGSFFWQMKI